MEEMNQQSNNKKKLLLTLMPVLVLIIVLVGVTYAFFNYTRTGGSQTISTGSIYFTSSETGSISVTNFFPTDSDHATHGNNSSQMTVTITAGTSYEYGIDYSLSAVNITRPSGVTTNIPVKVFATTSDSQLGFTPAAEHTITDTNNFSLGTGHINPTNSANSETDGGLTAQRITGTITVTAYIDAQDVAITDTPENNATWRGDRLYVSTDEWNRLAETPITFAVKVVAEEQSAPVTITYNANGGTVNSESKTIAYNATTYGDLATPTPASGNIFIGWYTEASGGTEVTSSTSFTSGSATTLYAHYAQGKCIRVTDATKLHTETCSQTSDYCAGDGYTGSNTTITYGNAKELGSSLTVGDAFDCDVNGNGVIDTDNGVSTERFYYVSPYYDVNQATPSFDNTTATLIYYKNFVGGSPNDGGAAYDSSNENWHGPVTALTHLPSTDTWSNITLKSDTRAILAEDLDTHNATTTGNGSKTLPTAFSYSGYAARLLTAQELMNGCGLTQVGSYTSENFTRCQFLFERTQYANTNTTLYPTYGPWLETPRASSTYSVWNVRVRYRNVAGNNANFTNRGVRPAIDVPMSAILK